VQQEKVFHDNIRIGLKLIYCLYFLIMRKSAWNWVCHYFKDHWETSR